MVGLSFQIRQRIMASTLDFLGTAWNKELFLLLFKNLGMDLFFLFALILSKTIALEILLTLNLHPILKYTQVKILSSKILLGAIRHPCLVH